MPPLFQEARFERIAFPVSAFGAGSGHELVEHVSTGRRGADLEHTQEQANKGWLEIPFFNDAGLVAKYGPLLPDLYYALIAKFRERPIGDLVTPSEGAFRAGIKAWSKEVRADQTPGGFTLRVEWVEHNGESNAVFTPYRPDPYSEVIDAASAWDTFRAALDSDLLARTTALASLAETQVRALASGELSPIEAIGAVGVLLGPISQNLRVVTTAANADAVEALERMWVATDQVFSEIGSFAPNGYTTQLPMAAWEVAQDVYGDASKAKLILDANDVPDPLAIPPGTTLTIPKE